MLSMPLLSNRHLLPFQAYFRVEFSAFLSVWYLTRFFIAAIFMAE